MDLKIRKNWIAGHFGRVDRKKIKVGQFWGIFAGPMKKVDVPLCTQLCLKIPNMY